MTPPVSFSSAFHFSRRQPRRACSTARRRRSSTFAFGGIAESTALPEGQRRTPRPRCGKWQRIDGREALGAGLSGGGEHAPRPCRFQQEPMSASGCHVGQVLAEAR